MKKRENKTSLFSREKINCPKGAGIQARRRKPRAASPSMPDAAVEGSGTGEPDLAAFIVVQDAGRQLRCPWWFRRRKPVSETGHPL